jgi:hypothetical protein
MYDLHILGWHSFQQLCLTITREILGQTVVPVRTAQRYDTSGSVYVCHVMDWQRPSEHFGIRLNRHRSSGKASSKSFVRYSSFIVPVVHRPVQYSPSSMRIGTVTTRR